jgi:hypothetical protein
MMILAMNIIRDRSSEGNELGSRSYGKEPPLRHKYVENGGETYTALRPQYSGAWVEGDEMRERGCLDDRVGIVDAAIAVAPPEAVGKYGALILGKWEWPLHGWGS